MNNEVENITETGTDEGESLLGNLVSKYLSWWPLFVGLVALSLLGAWLYLRYSTPIYQSTASIMVKDKEEDAGSVLESLNIFQSKKSVENEIQLMKSRNLSREVAVNLRLYAPIFQQNRIRATSAYTSSPIVLEIRNTDSIKPVQKVEFDYSESNETVQIAGKIYPLLEWNNTPYGVLRFLPNKNFSPVTEELKKPFYFSLMSVKSAGNIVLGGLEVSIPNKQASVIFLSYKDAQPKRGQDILNELIDVYNKAVIKDKSSLARNTMEFIDSRLGYVVKELDSVEQNLERYKKKNDIVDISQQGQFFLQTVGANDQKLAEINMQIAVLDKVEEYVLSKEKGSGSIVPSTFSISDPLLTQLLDRLYDLEAQYEKSKLTMGENFPARVALTEQISQVKPNILENIQNQRRSLDASLQTLKASSGRYSSFLSQMPQREKELFNISRQQAIKNSIYTYLLEKREETALSFYSTISDSRLIDSAETEGYPISPKKKAVWMAAILLGLGLSILIIEMRGLLNRSVMSRSEIEKGTKSPIIGEIIHEKTDTSIVIAEGVRSLAAEQFRQLRTALGYLGINGQNKKKLLVTSSVPGEGKSFVCANLGISLALVGKKVVLIELDIRKPKLSKLFDMNQEVGITHYFINEKSADEIIRPIALSNNLSLISCGPLPPNPSELIVNGKLELLLKQLEQQFDYIIIDTSPVVPVTDAYLISPMCDATLFVMRYGVTPKVYLQKFDRNNRYKSLKNLAIVFNGVKAQGIGNYTYGYAYGSGYIDESKTSKKKIRIRKRKEDA